jgi:probable HAF family extracellular repeat protein
MNRITAVTIVIIAAGLAASGCDDATAPAPSAAAPRPSLSLVSVSGPVQLGTQPGGGASEAYRVNNLGHAAGYARNSSGKYHAVVWVGAGQLVDLGTLGGAQSFALGISSVTSSCPTLLICSSLPPGSVEYVVGYSDKLLPLKAPNGKTLKMTVQHAFRWDAQNGMVDLGTLGGADSWAAGVDAAGNVYGGSDTGTGETHAFMWSPGSGMRDIGAFVVWDADAGWVAGTQSVGGAVRWSSSTGTLENLAGGVFGFGVNSAGWVAGIAETSPGVWHAALWTAPGQALDLGTLPGATTSEGWGVNALGWVVGYSYGAFVYGPFLWTDSDGMVALPTLPGTAIGWANDINGGYIVGALGTTINNTVAVMWTATQPEPPAACLVCAP